MVFKQKHSNRLFEDFPYYIECIIENKEASLLSADNAIFFSSTKSLVILFWKRGDPHTIVFSHEWINEALYLTINQVLSLLGWITSANIEN